MRPGGSVALIGGRYELVAERGGDQDVVEWEGFDAALERQVRVRLLRQELLDDPRAVERFWSSARAQARGSTRTGERILDGGTDPETGRVYIVREWSADSQPARYAAAEAARLPRGLRPGRPALIALILATCLACVLILRSGVQGWLAWVNEPLGQVNSSFALPPPTTPRPAATVVATQPAATARPTTAAVAATPKTTPTPAGVARRVVNTDGRGVALRAKPDGDRLPGKGYDEGATVMAFETVGQWTRIRGSDGREGWVLSVTLAP